MKIWWYEIKDQDSFSLSFVNIIKLIANATNMKIPGMYA